MLQNTLNKRKLKILSRSILSSSTIPLRFIYQRMSERKFQLSLKRMRIKTKKKRRKMMQRPRLKMKKKKMHLKKKKSQRLKL